MLGLTFASAKRPISRLHVMACLLSAVAVSSCGKLSFSSGSTSSQKDDKEATQSPADGSAEAQSAPGAIDASTSAGSTDETKGEVVHLLAEAANVTYRGGASAPKPVAIYFALDITGSMSAVHQSIKANIASFVKTLQLNGYAPTLGVVPFRDKIVEPRFPLSSDLRAFEDYMGSLAADGGGFLLFDAQEAALLATEQALFELNSREGRQDALKLIIVITDSPGHRGNFLNCQIDTTVNNFNALSAASQQDVKLFYAAADDEITLACSGYETAREQFDSLFERILPQVARGEQGAALPWPFAEGTLANDLPALLQKLSPQEATICLNQQAHFTSESGGSFQWKGQLPSVFADYLAGKPTAVSYNASAAEYKLLTSGKATLAMTRCCMPLAKAHSGDFSSCQKTAEISSLPFSIEGDR